MDKLYLTEKIYEHNDKLFYEEKNKIKEIKNTNWHIQLREYGWSKLHISWIKKLNKLKLNNLKEKSSKNSLYGILDCGENGDCLFHCISYALNHELIYNSSNLRYELSEYITEENYKMIIDYYRIFKLSDDFDENWDLENMTFEEFKEKIKIGGDDYWGDFFMISLLQDYLNVNFIILNSNYDTNEHYYYPLVKEYDENKKTILLLYENNIHFQLIGHFQDGNMKTILTHQEIPKEILYLIKYLR